VIEPSGSQRWKGSNVTGSLLKNTLIRVPLGHGCLRQRCARGSPSRGGPLSSVTCSCSLSTPAVPSPSSAVKPRFKSVSFILNSLRTVAIAAPLLRRIGASSLRWPSLFDLSAAPYPPKTLLIHSSPCERLEMRRLLRQGRWLLTSLVTSIRGDMTRGGSVLLRSGTHLFVKEGQSSYAMVSAGRSPPSAGFRATNR
jgi:hypothetical protein